MSSRVHTNALLAFLRADPQLAQIVFDGYVPGVAPTRYVLVFARSMGHDVDRFAGRQRPETVQHTLHCIGTIPAEAQWLADRVQSRLVNARVPVDGWAVSPVRHVSGDPMRMESTVKPAVYFLADDYAWEAQP